MADDLERRLERALGEMPASGPEAERRARRAALAALPAAPPSRRRAAPFLAAAAVLVVAGSATLAAMGGIDVRVGGDSPSPQPQPAPAPSVPPGQPFLPVGEGVAAGVGGRVWLATSRGLIIAGLPASAVTLSPRALYAAVGMGPSLVALAPGGRRPWTQRTPGPVVAISWAPYPTQVAYVVHIPGGFQLRLIEGDGDNDRLLADGVAPVAPAWRPDSKAVAFAAADGRPMLWDANTEATRPVAMPAGCTRPPAAATTLAFARSGDRDARLAVVTGHGRVAVTSSDPDAVTSCRVLGSGADITGLAWLAGGDLVTAERPRGAGVLRRLRVAGGALPQVAICRTPDTGYLAVVADEVRDDLVVMAARDPRGHPDRGALVEVWRARAPGAGGGCRLNPPLLAIDGAPARAAWSRPGAVSLSFR